MRISKQGINLIKKFEGLKLRPYTCPAGKLTIGYGHVISKNTPNNFIIENVLNFPITQEIAEEILKDDLELVENIINTAVKVKLSQGQFDALASLVYNWGNSNFKKSMGLKKLNSKNFEKASEEFFSKQKGVVKVNGIILKGLVDRRQAEYELWNA